MVLKKLRFKVIRYKFIRLKNIFFLPTLYKLRFFFKNKFSFIFNSIDKTENIAIYDLRANPITFDFVHFLGGASFFFKDKGGSFRLFIVNDNAETTGKSSWENYGDIINTEKQNTRIYSLLMPIAFCFSQCNQSINLIKPKELPYFLNKKHNIYPLRNKRNFYNFSFTGPVMDYKSIFSYILDSDFKPDINPPSFYNRVVKNYIKFIKKESFKNFNHVITLTLRSYDFQKGRNTLSEDIDYIINFCIKNNLLLIIVPDTDRVPTSEQNLILKKYKNIIWDAPSHCIFLRLSLYQESLLNIMNLNGPMTLAILGSKSRSIILNFGDETHSSNAGKSFSKKEYGINENSQPYSRFSCLVQWNKLDNSELEEHIKKLCPELGL